MLGRLFYSDIKCPHNSLFIVNQVEFTRVYILSGRVYTGIHSLLISAHKPAEEIKPRSHSAGMAPVHPGGGSRYTVMNRDTFPKK